MEHRLITDSRCSAVFGNVTVYIDSFEVTGEKKFTYQPTVSTGIFQRTRQISGACKNKGQDSQICGEFSGGGL